MPRYFFHVHVGDKTERDTTGLELPGLTEAIAAAQRARLEIMTEDELDQLWLEIMDETGTIVARIT